MSAGAAGSDREDKAAMNRDLTTDDVAMLLERLAQNEPGVVVRFRNGYVHAEWGGVPVYARVAGTAMGKRAIALSSPLGPYLDVEAKVSFAKLLEHLASTGATRAVVQDDVLYLETRVVPDELGEGRLDEVVAWRLAELQSVALAWRRNLRLGAPSRSLSDRPQSLEDLVETTPVSSQKALMIAAVGFGVAGADGSISQGEASKLHAWMRDVPSFRDLELHRVIDAIAALVDDPARTLLEAHRQLEPRERLLAWALANDMAHADGFTSEEERRYLSNVASIFDLSPNDVAPLVADVQECSIRRATREPPPPPSSDVRASRPTERVL